jgi:hypothetical protein
MATTASSSAEHIPSNATTRPLITDVARNETPDAVLASPFALSRNGSGISRVTG